MKFTIPSENAALKTYEIRRDCDAYSRREELLKQFWRKFGRKARQEEIYEELQGLDSSVRTHLRKADFNALEKLAASMPERWKRISSWTDDYYWWKFSAEYADKSVRKLSDLALIKVYVSVDDISKAGSLYCRAVRLLLEGSDNLFYSKISTMKRTDCMCFWVSRHGFDLLEEYFGSCRHVISGAMPFVAYRGNLGISRELSEWGSHSAQQAQLIASYFNSLEKESDIDLGEMYTLLVKAWNRELPEDHPVMREFRYCRAQTILILLDTMDVITGKTAIGDDHLLLQTDNCLWRTLGEASREDWDHLDELYERSVETEKVFAQMDA